MPATAQKQSAKVGQRKAAIAKQPEYKATRARRSETIKFLTLDEARQLFSGITDKRDKALFLLAYRHGLVPARSACFGSVT